MQDGNQRQVNRTPGDPGPAELSNRLDYLIALGMLCHERGRFAEAEACYKQIAAIRPDWGEIYNNLACAQQALRKFKEATKNYKRAIALDPHSPVAHHNLAYIYHLDGKLNEAVRHYRRAIAIKANYIEARNNIGTILLGWGQLDEALRECECALATDSTYSPAHNNLGNILRSQGKLDAAASCYGRAISLDPAYADAHNNLGCIRMEQGRFSEATACFQQAMRLRPGFAEAICNLGVALRQEGKLDEAVVAFQQAILAKPNFPDALNNCGSVFKDQGRIDEAAICFRKAIELNPSFAEAHCNRGGILQDQGRLDDAAIAYRKALDIQPGYPEALYNLAQLKTFQAGEKDITVLEQAMVSIDSVPVSKQPFLHFAISKALDDVGEYTRAFDHLLEGNRIKRQHTVYDDAATQEQFRQTKQAFDTAMISKFEGGGNSSETPIFILGMPRSGSTLIEQVLASHPLVQGGGELRTLPDIAKMVSQMSGQLRQFPVACSSLNTTALRHFGDEYLRRLPPLAADKIRITDKMPGNFAYIGLIHLLLPNARIIHCVRNPVATCVSCFSKLFASGMPYSYDLKELGRYYTYYQELMAHWRSILPPGRILDVCYEELVDDLEGQARLMIQHCGLPWDERCLSFHATSRSVSTGSNVHVRRPLFRTSLNRWQRFEPFLQPLLTELHNLQP